MCITQSVCKNGEKITKRSKNNRECKEKKLTQATDEQAGTTDDHSMCGYVLALHRNSSAQRQRRILCHVHRPKKRTKKCRSL